MVRNVQTADGRAAIAQTTYLLNEADQLVEGFADINGETYYAEGSKGLAKGWRTIDGHHYYFAALDGARHDNGARATLTGAFYFNADGHAVAGSFPSGYVDKPITWQAPTAENLDNTRLNSPEASRLALGEAIANYAAERQGLPFKWFGNDLNDPSGVYCCGAAYSAYQAFGIRIPGPDDTDMYADEGYRMVRDQYLKAEAYGGTYVPTEFSALWPGDLSYSKRYPHTYNHVAIFLGMNGGNAMVAHATLADGFVIEPTDIITDVWGYQYMDTVRYV